MHRRPQACASATPASAVARRLAARDGGAVRRIGVDDVTIAAPSVRDASSAATIRATVVVPDLGAAETTAITGCGVSAGGSASTISSIGSEPYAGHLGAGR